MKWYGEQYMKKSQPDITQSNNVNSGEAGLDTYIPPAGGGGTTSTKFMFFFAKLEGWKKWIGFRTDGGRYNAEGNDKFI